MTSTIVRRGTDGRSVSRDLLGLRFGKLTIEARLPGRCPNGYQMWAARCACGTVIERPSYRFVRATQRAIQTCPDCAPYGRPRIPNSGAHVNSLRASYRTGARSRGLAFELSADECRALFEADCTYCGAAPRLGYTSPSLSGEYPWNGIDRVDNGLGYVPGNVVTCCATCNRTKGTMTLPEFRAWIERAYRHMNRRKPKRQSATPSLFG